jgi:hypothetical protein
MQSEGQLSFVSQTLLQTPRQSVGQLTRVSDPSQAPLPQVLGTKQSMGQDARLSLAPQKPLPQAAQSEAQSSPTSQTPSQLLTGTQSAGQLSVVSEPEHVPSPQRGRPQSVGQVRAFSDGLHLPSPQPEVVEQSAGQVLKLSLPSQSPSPQLALQSMLQLWPPSLLLHTLSPQRQSLGQLLEFSVGAQRPSPQVGTPLI